MQYSFYNYTVISQDVYQEGNTISLKILDIVFNIQDSKWSKTTKCTDGYICGLGLQLKRVCLHDLNKNYVRLP